jgi:integrase
MTTTLSSKVNRAERPAKPHSDFPLFAHANGQWAKKINGKLHYLGPWSDPQAAEESYRQQKNELENHGKVQHKQSKNRRQKPEKPNPDYPLYPHPSGQWARKIDGQTKYFGPWNDSQGAERAYQDHISNQYTNTLRDDKARKPAPPPRKPRKSFPLWAHPSGQWAKKINGTTYYFGRWAEPDAAEEKYNRECDDLIAGRIPRDRQSGGCTTKVVCDKFLEQKRRGLPSGEISQRSVDDYDRTCAKITCTFGENRLLEDLTPDDFARLRSGLAESYGPVRLGNEIIRIRCVFKFAYDWGLIQNPMRYGGAFSKPKAAVLRRENQKKGKRMFSPEQIRAILKQSGTSIKAMVFLGINCGFGNEDCATLPFNVLDLERGWVDYARPKTAVQRSCPLWPETVAAINEYLAIRPKPAQKEFENLVFLTQAGLSWSNGTKRNSLTKEFTKVLNKLQIKRPGLSFYALRHTFYTAGEYCRDKDALEYIMGHAADGADMRPFYREETWTSRLSSIVKHVHRWVFEPKYAVKVMGSRCNRSLPARGF